MKLTEIQTKRIETNPSNPRGIAIQEDDPKLALLQDSIAEFGILVPLVVKPHKGKYLLLDGERRYWAAVNLGLPTVPAYIIRSNLTANGMLMRMFHIHHNREQWGPIQQCRALEPLYVRIAKRNNVKGLRDHHARIQAITSALVAETGIEARTAEDRILFLRWPQKIKQALYDKPSDDYWYIVEIEKGIILPALKNYPEYFRKVSVHAVRTDLFAKLKEGAVSKATEVRVAAPIVKFQAQKKSERRKILKILDDLRTEKKMTYEEGRDEFDRHFPYARTVDPPSPRRVLTAMLKLSEQLDAFDSSSFSKRRRTATSQINGILEACDSLARSLKALQRDVARLRT